MVLITTINLMAVVVTTNNVIKATEAITMITSSINLKPTTISTVADRASSNNIRGAIQITIMDSRTTRIRNITSSSNRAISPSTITTIHTSRRSKIRIRMPFTRTTAAKGNSSNKTKTSLTFARILSSSRPLSLNRRKVCPPRAWSSLLEPQAYSFLVHLPLHPHLNLMLPHSSLLTT